MNLYARLTAAGTLMIVFAGCSVASPKPAPTVTVTQSQPPPAATSSAPPSATSSAPSSAPASDVSVCVTPAVTCKGQLKSEPAQIIVSGDGSAYIASLTWTGWGLSSATGSGTLKVDNCKPNCAQGSYTGYQATVDLSDLTGHGGGAAYAVMTVAAPGSPFGTMTYKHLAP